MYISQNKVEEFYKFMPKYQFEYHIHISIQNSYIYFETPKVACSTTKATLQEIETTTAKTAPLPKELSVIHDKKISPLISPSDIGLEKLLEMLNDNNVFKFCFVRNPYTRLLSAFLSKINWENSHKRQIAQILGVDIDDKITFAQFVHAITKQSPFDMDPHWRIQTNQLFWGLVNYDFIGNFENFSEDLIKVVDRIYMASGNKSNFTLERENDSNKKMSGKKTSANSKLQFFYSDEIKDLVFEIYKADFQNFNYPKELPIV